MKHKNTEFRITAVTVRYNKWNLHLPLGFKGSKKLTFIGLWASYEISIKGQVGREGGVKVESLLN
jgi:hypothetical protein